MVVLWLFLGVHSGTALKATADHAPPTFAGFVVIGTTINLRFRVEMFYDYYVEIADSPASTNWTVLTVQAGKLGEYDATVSDSLSAAPHRFYRLRREFCSCR